MENKKVLIIDDDNRNIFALRAVLGAKKFICLTAASAEAGIDVLKKNADIDYVLIDMMMPEMDGYEAIPLMKKMDGMDNIPIISVTAQAMVGDEQRCLATGADGYISKPVDVDKLLAIMSRLKNHK